MLKIAQLAGFGSGSGGGTDATPTAIDFNNIADSGFTASAYTNVVTITGIDTMITLRLTLTVGMTTSQRVSVYRSGVFVSQGTSGSTIDVALTNGQTLQYAFTNTLNLTTWSGTATVTNLSDGSAILDTFTYSLTDNGSGPVGGVGGGPVGGPIP
jgi:hypothetical protein